MYQNWFNQYLPSKNHGSGTNENETEKQKYLILSGSIFGPESSCSMWLYDFWVQVSFKGNHLAYIEVENQRLASNCIIITKKVWSFILLEHMYIG